MNRNYIEFWELPPIDHPNRLNFLIARCLINAIVSCAIKSIEHGSFPEATVDSPIPRLSNTITIE